MSHNYHTNLKASLDDHGFPHRLEVDLCHGCHRLPLDAGVIAWIPVAGSAATSPTVVHFCSECFHRERTNPVLDRGNPLLPLFGERATWRMQIRAYEWLRLEARYELEQAWCSDD